MASRTRRSSCSFSSACSSRISFVRPEIPSKSGLRIEQRVDFRRRHSFFLAITLTIAGSRSPDRVPITSPSSGVMPIEVSTEDPALDRRRRAAISQMQRNDVGLLARQFPQGSVAKRYIAMRGPVKSIAADAVPAVEMIGNGIQISLLGDGMMERGIEYRDLRRILAEQFPRRLNALYVIGIVQRRQIDAVFDPFQHLIVDERRFLKQFSAMHHAMPDRMHVRRAFDFRRRPTGRTRCSEPDNRAREPISRSGAVNVCSGISAMLNPDDRLAADTLDFAAAHAIVLVLLDLLKIGRDHLKLQAGASRVKNQNIHRRAFRATGSLPR